MSLAPIVYFAYNRPGHTRQTLSALNDARLSANSELYIFIDGPKPGASSATISAIEEVKRVAAEKKWCGKVYINASENNKGLFKSIVNGITEVINRHGRVIVMEDDVLVSPGFLEYMNDALEFYKDQEKVMHISGFSRPDLMDAGINESTYFFFHTTCWGWATWQRAWNKFIPDPLIVHKTLRRKGGISELNMDNTFEFFWGLKAIARGKFQSWNTIWHSVVYLNDGLSLHPSRSLVDNIGHDGSGTNCEAADTFDKAGELADRIELTNIPLKLHEGARRRYNSLYSTGYRLKFSLRHFLKYFLN